VTLPTAQETIPASVQDLAEVGTLPSTAVVPAAAQAPASYSVPPPDAAQNLVTHALTQAAAAAALQEVTALRQQLSEERTAHAVQRANAEQARRVAECQRAFAEALLEHLAHPCFGLDRDGCVTQWNPAMARWSGLAEVEVIGKSLTERICAPLRAPLAQLTRAAFGSRAAALTPRTLSGPLPFLPGLEAARLTVIPLSRIPGCVEAAMVLVEPQS